MNNNSDWDGVDRRVIINGGGRSTFERHAQTVLGVVVTGGILWLGSSIIELGKEQSRATIQIVQMREDVRTLQGDLQRMSAERYTAGEARRELQRLEDRLERLEGRKK